METIYPAGEKRHFTTYLQQTEITVILQQILDNFGTDTKSRAEFVM